MQRVSTCLWFDHQAKEAAEFYTSVIPNSRILQIKHYHEGSPSPLPAGSVLTVEFTLDGTTFLGLNGGPVFQFTPAVSLVVNIQTQEEVDELWEKLIEGGGKHSRCGWLTDRFGLSWQIVPRPMIDLFDTPDREASQRAFSAMLTMTKLDIAAIQRAYEGA